MTNAHDIENPSDASAAFIAAGIGCAVLGLMTTLAEISSGVKNLLNWWDPAGPLTGKTGVAVIVWIAAWIALHLAWRNKTVTVQCAFTITLILIALGVIGTFPTFFEMFSH